VFGPLDIFNSVEEMETKLVAMNKQVRSGSIKPDYITSSTVLVDGVFENGGELEQLLVGWKGKESSHIQTILVVPGGYGTRQQVLNEGMLESLQYISSKVDVVMSVCTGSALLAKSGVLDGKVATSNKVAMKSKWVQSQSNAVNWKEEARFVQDGKYWTSSGITAGMDMSLAFISSWLGKEHAYLIAKKLEYNWCGVDGSVDPFYEK
jgi:transcriptional regulator GlxA family with amidase domain